MAPLNMSFRHGQPWETARANFETGINQAKDRFGAFLKSVEWSDDKTAARLRGSNFDVNLTLGPESVHAEGNVPFIARKLLEMPVRKFLEETFKKT